MHWADFQRILHVQTSFADAIINGQHPGQGRDVLRVNHHMSGLPSTAPSPAIIKI
jgi:hypothetical protein